MKNIYLFLFIFYISYFSVFSQNGWIVQTNILPQNIISVSFVSGGTGYALGTSGSISKTTNYGNNWVAGIYNNGITSYNIRFSTGNYGFIAQNEEIGKTNNGGLNWIFYTPTFTAPVFYSIAFYKEKWGVASGYYRNLSNNQYYGCVAYMDSSGSSGGMTILRIDEILYSISYPDTMVGYVAGGFRISSGSTIYKTTSGGLNFLYYNNAPSGTPVIKTINFINVFTGWIGGGNGSICKTTNAGANWITQNSGITSTINSSFFLNSQTGWMCGNNGKVIKTTDGGIHWRLQSSPVAYNLNSIQFLDSTRGWIGADNGTVLYTIDGGGITEVINRIENTSGSLILYDNYPNPFNPITKITFELPKDGKVKLVIYDILGRKIKTLVNELKQAGRYTVEFNGNNYASGVYFYRIQVEEGKNYTSVKKMMLIK
jgi:photosystem II stability/assembly factor-like uncharacterized protein